MGYYREEGLIGNYRGHEVYVIGYKDLSYTMSAAAPDRMYAVRTEEYGKMDVVMGGNLVGGMDDEGHMYMAKKMKPYVFYYKEESKEEEEEVGDYSRYSKVVDQFFEGLEKLWQEIDQSFVE